MSVFEAIDLSYSTGGATLVDNVSFALEPGSLTTLVGPNGAGKTTLLRMALGLLSPDCGSATIDGKHVGQLDPIERAQKAAYLPQTRTLVWPQPVRDIVALGRFAFGAAPGQLSDGDESAVAKAISACAIEGLERRAADTLSGGELTRVHLARALAAETPLLFADEPVAALDPRFQHEALRIFSRAAKEGRTVLTVIHDLALAARYADRIIWMKDGTIVADGSPAETITSDTLRLVFGIEAIVRPGHEAGVAIDILGPA